MISKKNLQKFKELYKKHFNEDLSDEDALEKAIKLRRMVEIVYQPITEKEYKDWEKRRAEREKTKDDFR